MPNPDLIPEPFAQSGDKNTIPLERAITDPVYRASWKVGFPPDTRLPKDVGGEAPDGLDFNGVLNILSQAVVFLQKGNAYQFDAALAPYPIGALVRSNDNLTTYQSTVPNNSNNPNTNMSGWRVYNGSGFIVDNLTTNDSAKALSAAQGKTLQDNKLDKTENAASATKLATARSIGGVNFDGTANINLPGVNVAGNQSTSGNAASATKLQTARTINNVLFDGTANITLPTASTSTSGTVQLNNTLTSSSESLALTAAQGKVLKDSKIETTARGAANGVASLDANTKVPVSQLPAATISDAGVLRFATATEVANRSNVSAAITPANVGQTFGQSLAADGWCKLPNGLIMQWGQVANSATSGTFPIAFTVTPPYFSISRMGKLGVNDDWDSTSGIAISNTTFNCLIEGSTGNWLAIGY